jgi:hypothetical protein
MRPNLLTSRTARGRGPAAARRAGGFDLAPVLRLVHVDEVDHDQAAEVAQAHLARHFVGGFQVCVWRFPRCRRP